MALVGPEGTGWTPVQLPFGQLATVLPCRFRLSLSVAFHFPPVFLFEVSVSFPRGKNSPDVLVHCFFERFSAGEAGSERTTKCAGCPGFPREGFATPAGK